MKGLNERTVDLVERQIIIAKRKNQPIVLKRLEKELETLKSKPKVIHTVVEPKQMEDTLDNRAAFLFYN